MPGFQSPITIFQAIERIRKNEYLLPAFQREFVWSSDQIEMLFDSLMQGYPISSMLFWKVKGETKTEFSFYQFLMKFVQRHETHNKEMTTDQINDFHAILDGQQRLTALYIGLCGSYAYHTSRRSWDYSEWSFPTRHLYLNISKTCSEEESDGKFIFSFISKNDSQKNDLIINNEEKWFRVGRILSLHQGEYDYDLDDFCEDHELSKESKKMLKRLDNVIHTDLNINFYEEEDQKPDKAVNIFVRINSGGTPLSISQILWSMATANWKKEDIRTDFENLENNIRSKGFYISKDYVLKSFLYLYHKSVRSEITSFKSGFMSKIEQKWQGIMNALISLFDLLKTFGLTNFTLTSYNATLPILYYLYHKNIYADFSTKMCYQEDRKTIKKWLFVTLIRQVFGSSSDNILTQSRRVFTSDVDNSIFSNDIENFPAQGINSEIKKVTDVSDESIEGLGLLKTQKDGNYCFPILAMLYPDLDYKNNNFHLDHLHPAASYNDLKQEDKDNYGWRVYNSILNLQMLDANENMSKNDKPLEDWVNEQTKDKDKDRFLENHLIPKVDLKLDNFSDFIEKRKEILIAKLKSILN